MQLSYFSTSNPQITEVKLLKKTEDEAVMDWKLNWMENKVRAVWMSCRTIACGVCVCVYVRMYECKSVLGLIWLSAK